MQLHEPPPFIPEGYTPITEAIAAIDGGWPALRQHLCAGRVRGFIFTDEKREALEKWAGHIRDLTEPPPRNVVRLEAQG